MGPFRDGWTEADVEAVLANGEPQELLYVPIVVSLDPPDWAWSQAICVRLAGHPDANVRGNAILGFAHLARVCGKLDEAVVRPLIESALRDDHPLVRGRASDAADDAAHFLGWCFQGSRPVEPLDPADLPVD